MRVGKVGRAQGIRGEVRVFPDDPASQSLALVSRVLFADDTESRGFTLTQAQQRGRFWALSLQELGNREDAARWTQAICYVWRDDLPSLTDDDIYVADLLGMRLEDEAGQGLGVVSDSFDNGAQEVLVYRTDDGTEVMIPFVDAFVVRVDRGSRVLFVDGEMCRQAEAVVREQVSAPKGTR